MEASRVIKFFTISRLFKDDQKQIERGENAYNSGHVKKVNFFGHIEPAVIKGHVHASMKNKLYEIEISVDLKKDEVVAKHCSCPRGLDVCHHMAALLYYAHYNISSTDSKRSWGITQSSESETDELETIETLFGHNESYKAILDSTQLDKNKFRETLGDTSIVGFAWLLRPEGESAIMKLVPSIEDIIFSEEFITNDNKYSFFTSRCSLTFQQIREIAEATIGQSKNEYWLIARKNKVTASKFGLVLKAHKRNRFPPSLYKSLLEGYDLDHTRAVQWGISHEESALAKFREVVGHEVIKTGLWLDQCGFLGGSPDGLVGDDSILEIKCPYSMRNTVIKEYINEHKYFFKYENDNIVIDANHTYYHQIQGQLHLTGRKQCYFFVWTPTDHEVFVVEKDDDWGHNMTILKEFYLKIFLPKAFNIEL